MEFSLFDRVAQYGLGGAIAAAVLLLHWMSLRAFAKALADERAAHGKQIEKDREANKGVWEQLLSMKLAHHTEVMRVLSEHSVILAELRILAGGWTGLKVVRNDDNCGGKQDNAGHS